MIIRCERCSTVYELEDGVLPPEGSDVQCAKCQHVFRAGLPQAARPAREAVAPAPEAPAPQPRAAPAPSATAPAPAGRRPTVYRPPVSQPSVARAPVLRRDTVGTFESRLRWSHRWRWLAPALVVIAGAAGAAVYVARGRAPDRGIEEARARALELALADDVKSLEDAVARLRGVETAPGGHAARADRALAELLLAGAVSEPEPGGARREQARALVASASAALDDLARANLARPEVARARAVAASLGGDQAALKRLATAARAELPDDVFVAVAEHGADVRSTDRSARERALTELRLLLARRPELVRARYLVSKGLALAGRRNDALAAAEDVLHRNPRHEGALGLREAMTRPPASVPIAPPAPERAAAPDLAAAEQPVAAQPPAQPARAEKPAPLPRKRDSTAGEREPAPAAEPAPGPGVAGGVAEPAPADAEPPPPPRLRPAAVPEPEVVEGGG